MWKPTSRFQLHLLAMSENKPLPSYGKIGIFDSGYGGLTILRSIKKILPQYDYLYLGDNARAPYGTRSFDIVYRFTLEAVKTLFARGCHLVILACNTASAKALRSIQQNDLPIIAPAKRVLGVIRPTVEVLGNISKSRRIGILATPGTVRSNSYTLEIQKLFPDMKIYEQACPLWVPIIEAGEAQSPGADYFVKKYIDSVMSKDKSIDTLVLGCTHYPLLMTKIRQAVAKEISIVSQGDIVAGSLKDYLSRHPEIESKCAQNGTINFLTTENPEQFNRLASIFLNRNVEADRINLPA